MLVFAHMGFVCFCFVFLLFLVPRIESAVLNMLSKHTTEIYIPSLKIFYFEKESHKVAQAGLDLTG